MQVTSNNVRVFIVLFVLFVLSLNATAQAGSASSKLASEVAQAERLTLALGTSVDQYSNAARAEKAQREVTVRGLAQQRAKLLSDLMENSPADALRLLAPDSVRGAVPNSAQPYVEQTVTAEGVVDVLVEDHPSGSRTNFFLKTASERLKLHFGANAPYHLKTGDRIRVNGSRLNSDVLLRSGTSTSTSTSSVQTLSLASSNTFGNQSTLVILVNFQDNTSQPYTPTDAYNVVFGTTSNFDMENSQNQTWLTGTVAGWFTIPMGSTACDYYSFASYAESAATAAGYNVSAYPRRVIAFPAVGACSWWGMGNVGGNPSRAWVNGTPFSLAVVGHEMGHNFGLNHSHSYDCGSVTLSSSCTVGEYGDNFDLMGNGFYEHFSAFQKERLGWLNYGSSNPILTVQSSGTYTLSPYALNGGGYKALKILKSTDSSGYKTWYYVEFRQPVGFDGQGIIKGNSNVINGVMIHTGSESSGNTSYLLDMQPTSTSWNGPALDVGQTFTDTTSGVSINVASASSTGAAVNVSLSTAPCAKANPTVVLSPSQSQWMAPGATATYTLSVTNNDSTTCTMNTYNVTDVVPSGWNGVLGTSALNLNPGASGSTTVQVTSPNSAATGYYNFSASAANASASTFAASTTGTYVVASSLGVTVTANQAGYTRGQTISVTTTVTANGAAVSGASVAVSITKANGTQVKLSGTTASNGAVTLSYKTKKQDPAGTYQVQATAKSGSLSGTTSTSFAVK